MAEELTRALTALAERGEERGAAHVLDNARRQAGLDPTGRRLSPSRWRRGVLVAATAAAAVLVLVGVVTVLGPFAGDKTPVTQPSGEWVAGQPVEIGQVLGPIESGFGSVWVATGTGVARLDPETQEVVATISAPNPSDLAVGGDAVWLVSTMGGGWRTEVGPGGTEEGTGLGSVTRIDPGTNSVAATIPVGASLGSLAIVGDEVWVANAFDTTISIIDHSNNAVIETIDTPGLEGMAVVGDKVWGQWLEEIDDRAHWMLRRYDPVSRQLETTIDVTDQIVGDGSPWFLEDWLGAAGGLWSIGMVIHSDAQDETAIETESFLYRFDGETGELLASIPIGRGWGGSTAFADGILYATDCLDATVTAIDVETNQVIVSGFPVGRSSPRESDYDPMIESLHSCPGGIAVFGDTLYVSLLNDGTVVPVDLSAEPEAEQQPVSTQAIPSSCAECDPGTIGEMAILEVGDGRITLNPGAVRAADSERCPRGCWVPSFRVTNAGSQVHKIDVIVDWGGQDPADLPVWEDASAPNLQERVYGYSAISSGGEIRLQPGQTMDGFPLEPGEYLLICNEPGHYSAGEYALLTVLEPTGEPSAPRGLHPGQPAPPWKATLLDGTPVSTSSLLGRPSLLVVWDASDWWPEIGLVLPDLESISADYGDQVNAWAVAIGAPQPTVEEQTSGYSFPVVVDQQRQIPETWGGAPWAFPTNQPTVVLLDSDGLVAQVLDHPPQPGELNELLEWITNGP